MALELYIPPCILDPVHQNHLPPFDKPLRVQIEGPLSSIMKLIPDAEWKFGRIGNEVYPQPAAPVLAKIAFEKIYGRQPRQDTNPNDVVVRDQYFGNVIIMENSKRKILRDQIDYYGVTFDHLVPADDNDPEVLQINIVEVDEDNGEYANAYLLFHVDPAEYTGKKVLAVPRCCQKRKGTQDRGRIDDGVVDRDAKVRDEAEAEARLASARVL